MAISSTLQRSALRIDFTVLGYLGILGSPLLACGVWAMEAGQVALGNGLMLSFLLGWLGSMAALRGTGAFGKLRWGRATSNAHFATLTIAILWQATQTYHNDFGKGSLLFTAGDLCWPISVIGMILVGIATLAAKRWRGWHRFTPLACGLCFPIGMAAQAIHPSLTAIFAVITAWAWSALGLAALLEGRRHAKELNA